MTSHYLISFFITGLTFNKRVHALLPPPAKTLAIITRHILLSLRIGIVVGIFFLSSFSNSREVENNKKSLIIDKKEMRKGQTIDNPMDIIVIGGGINGAGIALDASGRDLKVGLYEAGDFASATSSASSKLIHGGLRYLEQFKFRLVRESLIERDILLKKAPHIIEPVRFCLPYHSSLRPKWVLRTGLFVYDYLDPFNSLEKSQIVSLKNNPDIDASIDYGFEYSDCKVDDSRLVLLNLISAKKKGAEIRNYCSVIKASQEGGLWVLTIKDHHHDKRFTRYAKVLVNATGPWVDKTYKDVLQIQAPERVRLVKGSHIIIENKLQLKKNYILQNTDNRVVFVMLYLNDQLMVGTTDTEYAGALKNITIDEAEKDYLINAYNNYFKQKIVKKSIKYSFSGVRPLFNDKNSAAKEVTRDYVIVSEIQQKCPLISIYGGKITTYRKLAENVMSQLSPHFHGLKNDWTKDALLPGAYKGYDKDKLTEKLIDMFNLNKETAYRLATTYGDCSIAMFSNTSKKVSDSIDFGGGLTEIEVDYLIKHEMVKTVDDILWRRTKLGLNLTREGVKELTDYLKKQGLQNKNCINRANHWLRSPSQEVIALNIVEETK